MEIRHLTPKDLWEVSNVYVQSWKYAYQNIIPQSYLDTISNSTWSQNLCREEGENLIVIEDNRIIGTSSICRSRWTNYAHYGEIISIYFLPAYIGRGYGRVLMTHTLNELQQLGYSDILLWVLEDNTAARKFYEKYGFVKSSDFKYDQIGGKDLKEIMYEYHIE